jgi:nucleoside-diphosphate-sugar epimerase
MNSIFLTGYSGFIGVNLIEYFGSYKFNKYQRESPIDIYQDVVIHLAGKAHDLKKISNPNEYY